MELMHTAHVPSGDGPHPTIVLLHGWGANAHDLLGLAPLLHSGKAMILCPQGTLSMGIGQGMAGYGWFDLSQGMAVDPAQIDKAATQVSEFIDAACERYAIDTRHLVLGGFSQGGVVAYKLALSRPQRFTGLIALSSWLPQALAAAIERKPEHANLATIVLHGLGDPMIPIEKGRESRDALLKLGVPTVYHEYAMGHEIAIDALRALVAWVDEKVFEFV